MRTMQPSHKPTPAPNPNEFHTAYSVYNSLRYPMPQRGPGKSPRASRDQNKSRSRQRVGPGLDASVGLSRVQSVYGLSRGDFRREENYSRKLLQGHGTIVELPELQCTTRSYMEKSKKVGQMGGQRSSVKQQTEEELEQLKQKTIYRSKQPTRNTHEIEETYFGLFAARNKCKQAKNSEIRNDSLERDKEREGEPSSELDCMKKEYSRLRLYLDQLEGQNRQLQDQNAKLAHKNKQLQRSLKDSRKERGKDSQGFQRGAISRDRHDDSQSSALFSNDNLCFKESRKQDEQAVRSVTELEETYIDVCQLLGKAKEQILARDKLIEDLRLQLAMGSKTVSPISPLQIGTGPYEKDNQSYEHILSLKRYLEKANGQERMLRAKIEYLQQQLNSLLGQVQVYMQKYEKQRQAIMEKEVEMEVHVKYTRGIMAKLGLWEPEDTPEAQRVWYSRDDDSPSWEGTAESYGQGGPRVMPLYMREG